MATRKISWAQLIIKVGLALFLITAGILSLQLDSGLAGRLQASFGGNELAIAVNSIFKGEMATVVIVLLGALQLLGGIFLLVDFFVNTKAFSNFALLVLMIVWLAIIVLVDVLGKGGLVNGAFQNLTSFLSFLKLLASHLLVLGAIILVRE